MAVSVNIIRKSIINFVGMSALIIGISAIIAILVAVILTLTYSADQQIKCPYCQLEYTTDLLSFRGSSMSQCPFCHKWFSVKTYEDHVEI